MWNKLATIVIAGVTSMLFISTFSVAHDAQEQVSNIDSIGNSEQIQENENSLEETPLEENSLEKYTTTLTVCIPKCPAGKVCVRCSTNPNEWRGCCVAIKKGPKPNS